MEIGRESQIAENQVVEDMRQMKEDIAILKLDSREFAVSAEVEIC